MKNYQKILLTCALIMLVSAGIRPALSYFTTYVEAKGKVSISLEENGRIEERVEELKKSISITNTGEPAVYVRVQAFVAEKFKENEKYSSESGKWIDGKDGWWYYSDPVAPGAATDVLDYEITKLPEDLLNNPGQYGFNVVVVYETAPVIYDENGQAADVLDVDANVWGQVKTEGGQ